MRRSVLIVLVAASAIFTICIATVMAQKQPFADSPTEICPILTGSELPPIKVLTLDGEEFDLNRAVAAKPTILIYYRGGW